MRLISTAGKHFLSLLLLPILSLAFQTPTTINNRRQVYTFSPIARSPLGSPTTFSRLRQSQEEDNNTAPSPPSDRKMIPPALQLLGKTTSTFVAGTFFVVLAWKRDALMVAFFVGAIANGILSKVLKKLINQERPMEEYDTPSTNSNFLEPPPPSDNGMPSSHAMSLGFIGTFTALVLYNPYVSLLLVAYASISLWYRIESKLHTWEQVAVGMTVGTTNAVLWRCLCWGSTQPFLATPPRDLPFSFLDFVTRHWLNEEGLWPIWALSIPMVVGALVVGSVERRIGRFLKMKRAEKEAVSKEA